MCIQRMHLFLVYALWVGKRRTLFEEVRLPTHNAQPRMHIYIKSELERYLCAIIMDSQELPVSEELWSLVRYLDRDESFWVVPVHYIEHYEKWIDFPRGSLVGQVCRVWCGRQGFPASPHETAPQITHGYRTAKIFCLKETSCCAYRVYHFSGILKEEGSLRTQRVQRIVSTLAAPEEDLNSSVAICNEEYDFFKDSVAVAQDISFISQNAFGSLTIPVVQDDAHGNRADQSAGNVFSESDHVSVEEKCQTSRSHSSSVKDGKSTSESSQRLSDSIQENTESETSLECAQQWCDSSFGEESEMNLECAQRWSDDSFGEESKMTLECAQRWSDDSILQDDE